MKTIKELDITGKRVFIRVDFNVPMDAGQNITDDIRVRTSLPTIAYAVEQGAKVILASHLGRPKGKRVPEMSLAPVAKHLSGLLGREVAMAPDCVGDEVASMVGAMKGGEVLLLENLRYYDEEQANDAAFAAKLAGLCDVYVNNAFAVSHRVHASVAAITEQVAEKGAGLLLEKEIAFYNKAMEAPVRPLVAIIGGAKISSKLGALTNMLNVVDKVIIGGAMANTFLKAQGLSVGNSLVEDEMLESARAVITTCREKGIPLYLPEDGLVAREFSADADFEAVSVNAIPEGTMMLDIGPETTSTYAQVVAQAKTIVWNGPMGAFEMAPFSKGTLGLVAAVAEADALTVVGGGDTDVALHMAGAEEKVSYVSTGGGAFLTLMEGKPLPGVTYLGA
ncbi:phosphoglycerate kinase [Desulfoluna spongiiphila]|uniref:Phosphoglycerate kinase n=1 Tax=Desulfoluna spongiiphila TaxID=419481 RepID=A0A1G5F1G9_9BACT|nr:phosphoglycerate kinase [Desulfoluna spongiiphila]SCY32498.1 phosphoglycerate kinase [Desulfoluna spongiiphila]VVS94414.1 phosphoglycerate kinase [Desulfoluna spongiiphila]